MVGRALVDDGADALTGVGVPLLGGLTGGRVLAFADLEDRVIDLVGWAIDAAAAADDFLVGDARAGGPVDGLLAIAVRFLATDARAGVRVEVLRGLALRGATTPPAGSDPIGHLGLDRDEDGDEAEKLESLH